MSEANKFELAQQCIDEALGNAQSDNMRERIENVHVHPGNAEPGYDDEVCVTGDFNRIGEDKTASKLYDALQECGIEGYWGDEWETCDKCHKIVRRSPDSYSWLKSSVFFEDTLETVCETCLKADADLLAKYIEGLEGDVQRALTFEVDLPSMGYVQVATKLERGFHPGQDADPEVVGKALDRRGIHRYVFTLDCMEQFSSSFSVYVKSDELVDIDEEDLKLRGEEINGPSISQAMILGLKRAGTLPPVEPGKVRVVSIGLDGLYVKESDQSEFVAGGDSSDVGKLVAYDDE